MYWIQSHLDQKNDIFTISSSPSLPYNGYYSLKDSTTPSSSSSSSSSTSSKITPAILIIIVILAVIFLVLGLLHLLVRFLLKHRSSLSNSHSNRYPEMSRSNSTFQRQLQQLFHLHDSGLDQSFIDALPVFHYKELMMDGLKEPFDCPVCLSEFSQQDKLRLLPLCSHAFHMNCIDTWLLSNSTCPLCRGSLYNPGLHMENPIFGFEDSREEVCFSGRLGDGVLSSGSKPDESGIMNEKRVFSVRLGKYRNINNGFTTREKEEAEPSDSSLDSRRCYSMGSFQYVVANSDLQVTLCQNKAAPNGDGDLRIENGREGKNGNLRIDEDCEDKKINIGGKNESFSVSKVWLWSKKGKFTTSSSNIHMDADLNLYWANSSTNPI